MMGKNCYSQTETILCTLALINVALFKANVYQWNISDYGNVII